MFHLSGKARIFVLQFALFVATSKYGYSDQIGMIRDAMAQRAQWEDPKQGILRRKCESGLETEQRIAWRENAKLFSFERRNVTSVVRCSNPTYGFRASANHPKKYLLEGFEERENRASFVEPWNQLAGQQLRYDLFVNGRYSILDLLKEKEIEQFQPENGLLRIRISPSEPSDILPKSIECTFDTNKAFLMVNALAESTSNQKVRWEVVEAAEIKPKIWMAKKVKLTIDQFLCDDEFEYSYDELPKSNFTLSAFGLPEPLGVPSVWTNPVTWMFLTGILLLSIGAYLRRIRKAKEKT